MRARWGTFALGFALIAIAVRCTASPLPQSRLFAVYRHDYISVEGRVIDRSMPDMRTTSEAQAYAMHFAVENADRALFEKLWRWTRRNLMPGARGVRLPAWLWGKNKRGHWGIEDPHSASDADLWMADDLLRAARRWGVVKWRRQGRALLRCIARREVVRLRDGTPLLLPGDSGFRKKGGDVVNLSYWAEGALADAAQAQPSGPWRALLDSLPSWISKASAHGFVPNWIRVLPDGRVAIDERRGAVGSYDAIRVYLWASLSAEHGGRIAHTAEKRLDGPLRWAERHGDTMPEEVNVSTGTGQGKAPVGFDAVWAKYLDANHPALARHLWRKVWQTVNRPKWLNSRQHYYDFNLILWALQR